MTEQELAERLLCALENIAGSLQDIVRIIEKEADNGRD